MHARIERYFRDNTSYEGLGRASLHSGAIFMLGRLLNILVQVGSTIVLARILGPTDFGLVAQALALVAFAPLIVDFGTADASNQQARITPTEISALFWFNMAIGASLTVLFAVCSPLIARLFGQPELAGIMLLVSLTFVTQALSVQHYALMRRAMEFHRITVLDTFANLASTAVAIGMALTGWGYWALVVKSVLTLAIVAAGAWAMCPWVPGAPKVTPEVKKLVRFGSGVTGFAVTDAIAGSLDRVALGYFYGAGPVGFYQNAFLLYSNVITVLTTSLHNVAVSGLSKLRDDADELKRAWFSALSLVSFLSALAFAVLAPVAEDIVAVLLGPKWGPSGVILCILAFRGIAQSSERTLGWLHVVSGRSDRWMRWGLFSAACQLIALAAGLPFGATGVAASYAGVMFLLAVPALVYAGQPFGITAKDVLAAIGPQVVGAVIAALLGIWLQAHVLAGMPILVRLVLCPAFCVAAYLLVVVRVFKVSRPLELVASMAGHIIAKRFGTSERWKEYRIMPQIEQFFIALDRWPLSALYRAAIGFLMLPLLRGVLPADASAGMQIAGFLAVLVALRVVPAVLRKLLPFSVEAKTIWRDRRMTSKRFDSYQWQKLFWIGIGLVGYAAVGSRLTSGEAAVALFCLLGGGLGLVFWKRVEDGHEALAYKA
jgi:PST family polysaccharide transporter